MNIVFMRHAIAEEREDFQGTDDSLRPLTKKGIVEFQNFLYLLTDLLPKPEKIFYSPYTRTMQTAQILEQAYGGVLNSCVDLEPGGLSADILNHAKNSSAKTAYFVGHQPDLGQHLNYFVKDGLKDTGESFCQFKKGGFVWLKSANNLEKGRVELVCSLHPPQIRRLLKKRKL